ncbi:hypothetical protein SEA_CHARGERPOWER_95 [Mycobacterium phage Chargerpower]|nr:hypothetical protein SEA_CHARGERPOWER_95 [Mycobacterium phage Chargerpower]
MSNSQHIVLEALENAVYEAIDQGTLDAYVLENVPQSHVFYPEPGEYWDEDDVAAIRSVGDSDLAAKIAYFSELLDR